MSRLVIVFSVVLSLLTTTITTAFFSINYVSDERKNHPTLMTAPGLFNEAPSAEHVADIYTRLSGLPPLMWEGQENMPAVDILAENAPQPVLLEIVGGRLPENVKPVIQSSAFETDARGPNMEDVVNVLKQRGIEVDTIQMMGTETLATDLNTWLANQAAPVVVLHHEAPSAAHYVARHLAQARVKPLTEFQISQYQICLWTGVGMVLLVLASVCCIIQMEVIPDSLLYAKFQSARTHKND